MPTALELLGALVIVVGVVMLTNAWAGVIAGGAAVLLAGMVLDSEAHR